MAGAFRDIKIKLTSKGILYGQLVFDAYARSTIEEGGVNTIPISEDDAKVLVRDGLLIKAPKSGKYKLTRLGSTLYSFAALMPDMTGSSDLSNEFNWAVFKGELVLCIGPENTELYRMSHLHTLRARDYVTYEPYVEQFKKGIKG